VRATESLAELLLRTASRRAQIENAVCIEDERLESREQTVTRYGVDKISRIKAGCRRVETAAHVFQV